MPRKLLLSSSCFISIIMKHFIKNTLLPTLCINTAIVWWTVSELKLEVDASSFMTEHFIYQSDGYLINIMMNWSECHSWSFRWLILILHSRNHLNDSHKSLWKKYLPLTHNEYSRFFFWFYKWNMFTEWNSTTSALTDLEL